MRDVLVKPKNNGVECGLLTNTLPCPEVDAALCSFEAWTSARIHVTVSAFVYGKSKDRVTTVLKEFLRKDVFLENGLLFKLAFSDAIAVEGNPELVEIDVDVITDAAEVDQGAVEQTLQAASAESVIVLHDDPDVKRLKGMVAAIFSSDDVFTSADINGVSKLLPSDTWLKVMKSFLRLGWTVAPYNRTK